MGTFGISTDMGALKFGLATFDGSSAKCVIPPPTNLLAFSKLPYIPLDSGKDYPASIPKEKATIAKLKNGNEIWLYNFKLTLSNRDSYGIRIEFHDYRNPQNNFNSGFSEYFQKRHSNPSPTTYEPGLFTAPNFPGDSTGPAGGVSFLAAPASGSKWENGVGMLFRSPKYPDSKMAEFTAGSLIPVFPGPDNGEDPEGGDGDGPDEIEDDPIEIPGDPSLSAANAGLLTLYTPTLSQIHNLGSYLWSDSFSLDTFKKLFSDPMEAIIGLSVVPVSVPTSGEQNIVIGVTDSGVSANRAASQYVTVDCGTISVKPTWNTAIDFEPYTKFSVFLPFIGTREISTDDIMGKDVNIKYLVDVFSGACTAHIKVGGSVLYQFSGSCTTPIPISALSWSNLVTSSIGLLAGGTAAAATGGVAGGVALAAMTAGAVARSKPTIQRAGNVSGAAGMLGVRVPYLIRETPRQSLAKDYNKFVGYPSNITSKLSDLKGYTQVENVHLEGIPATGDELSEIESLLKEGVIL